MKDIPVFSCPDGIATLILREVPFRGEGYILVRGVFGTLEGLLAECAGFCRAAGAERLFAAGEADFSGYPAAIRILGRSAPRESLLPAPEAVRLVPVTEETAADWALEYNARFRAVPAAESCSPAEERALAAGGEACGSGTVQSASALAACAAVSCWQWRRCCRRGRTLRAGAGGRCAGPEVLPDVRRGEYARHAAVWTGSLFPRRGGARVVFHLILESDKKL